MSQLGRNTYWKRKEIAQNHRPTKVSIELVSPDDPEHKARYTITVADSPRALDTANMKFAAFVVPQGREREWLFGTAAGRQRLLESAGCGRLAVVRLHRDQVYESLAAVQSEVADIITRLAPQHRGSGPPPKIPFLSVGSDLGSVTEVARGRSELSGEYVVEDVEGADNQLFRRLVFLSNQGVVQSEARLSTVEDGAVARRVVDVSYLTCEHHGYMSLGVATALSCDKMCDVLVVGLGGGALCTYLRRCFPMVNITAVDIDPVVYEIATKHFGLSEDVKLQVVIEDGLNYLKNAANKGVRFGAILFDVDSKDSSLGLSCPPTSFLELDILSAVSQTLDESGVFVLNFVCRVEDLRRQTLAKLRKFFKNISSVKLAEEVNEVFFCVKDKPLVSLEVAVNKLNKAVKDQKLQKSDLIDKTDLNTLLRVL